MQVSIYTRAVMAVFWCGAVTMRHGLITIIYEYGGAEVRGPVIIERYHSIIPDIVM